MKELVYKCDICEKTCNPDQMLHISDRDFEKDICCECLEKLVKQHFKFEKIIDSVNEKKPLPSKKKSKKIKEEKKEEKGKIDWGKGQALRDAGWTLKQISEELHCSEQTVANHTVVHEKKKPKPFEWAEGEPDLRTTGTNELI